jgi:hypothetical protein
VAVGGGHMLIFLVGALLGVIMGGTLCVRYLRREIAADIGPRLKRVQLQLDNIESQLNLAIVTRYAELGSRALGDPPRLSP